MEAKGPLGWCENGIHACRIDDLPHWLGPELWVMELGGERVAAADSVVARRARLLDRIDAWSGGVAREFADSCAQRATALATRAPSAAGRAADAVADAASGWVVALPTSRRPWRPRSHAEPERELSTNATSSPSAVARRSGFGAA